MDASMGTACCFTGHRIILPEHAVQLPEVLNELLDYLIDVDVTLFKTGGAIGFDTLVALKVLEKKQQHPSLRLMLCLPCRDQNRNWNDLNQAAYQQIREQADEVVYVGERYTPSCMMERNRMLVNGSKYCVAYCLKNEGGTAYTLRYAQKSGVRVLNIADILKKAP